jgi:hypothetical protein
MTRPTEGCCGTCGWLAKRVKPPQPGQSRTHEGFFEADLQFREHPSQAFKMVPGDTNAWHDGEFACFRHVADLPGEMLKCPAEDVVWADRHCPQWSAYEPGISPREHLAELKARRLEEDRREFQLTLNAFETQQADRERRADRRLMSAAIWLAVIIGAVQVITSVVAMTPDAVGYRSLRGFWCWLTGT